MRADGLISRLDCCAQMRGQPR